MWVIRREPSRRRCVWMITSIDEQIISRMVCDGSEKPAIMIIDSMRDMASRGRVGVQRAHRAVMAGVHGLQQVESLRAAHLADDDALGPHAQAVAHQVAHGDLALALEVGRTGLQTHDVRLLQLQFGRVLAGDDALVRVDIVGQAVQQGRLAGTGAARDHDVAAHPADDLEDLRALRRDRAELDRADRA